MKKRALFVGVDEYEDGSIARLDHAVDDAEALAAVFGTLLGFERVERLRNPRGKKDILQKVRELTAGLGKGDLFFFFFAGHGFRVKDNHVLVCAEDLYADLEDEYDGLPVGQLKKQAWGAWDRMLVIDACQNDIRKSRGADEGMCARDLSLILEDGKEDGNHGGEGVQVVVTSCSEGQKALEVGELGHGLFTSALLETVKEHAAEHRRLDMAGFRSEMAERMGTLAKRYRLNGKQNPMFRVPGECAIVLLDGTGEAVVGPATAKNVVHVPGAVRGEVCETCGRYRLLTELFKCRKCGKWHCADHQDPKTFLCTTCTEEQKKSDPRDQPKAPSPSPVQAVEGRAFTCGTGDIPMRWCPATTDGGWRNVCGTDFFWMGSRKEEEGRNYWLAWDGDVAEVRHRVRLSHGFWIGETEVTQRQWEAVMGTRVIDMAGRALADEAAYEFASQSSPGRFWRGAIRQRRGSVAPADLCYNTHRDAPIYWVSWDDAVDFCRRLTERERAAGRLPAGYVWRLPTEAEWEYACRAGTDTTLPNGEAWRILGNMNAPALDGIAWYGGNSAVGWDGPGADVEGWRQSGCQMQHPVDGNAAMRRVDQKNPNAWGIRDMLGNVWEWCHDWMSAYPQGEVRDPTGPQTGRCRVVRGGSWYSDAAECRPACRWRFEQGFRYWTIGFRVVLGADL